MIDRGHAARIAVEKLQLHSRACDHLTVRKVASISETARRPVTYALGNVGIEDCWTVYFEQANCAMLCSSTIMLISRATGEEVYFGTASDEG